MIAEEILRKFPVGTRVRWKGRIHGVIVHAYEVKAINSGIYVRDGKAIRLMKFNSAHVSSRNSGNFGMKIYARGLLKENAITW